MIDSELSRFVLGGTAFRSGGIAHFRMGLGPRAWYTGTVEIDSQIR